MWYGTMPLSFQSLSHGTVAFGFFHIESDMLLLEDLFFFAEDFCARVVDLATRKPGDPAPVPWNVCSIQPPQQIGDLMGAIHGVRYTGFIGDLYRQIPFPERPEDFRQKPEGALSRERVVEVISPYSRAVEIDFSRNQDGVVRIGEYRFDEASFQALIDYVWRGGYPRWKDDRRPAHVTAMAAAWTG